MKILITRPQPSAADTATDLAALGYDCLVAPVLEAISLPVQPVSISQETLIVTSPQAARALAGWPQLHSLPVLAVGMRTAQLLRAGGFTQVESADGDAAAILAKIDGQPQNFILACAPTTGQWLEVQLQAAGYQVRRLLVYEIHPVDTLPAGIATVLAAGSLSHVLFYSAFTARTFLNLVGQAKMIANLADLTACCLSPAVAAAAQQASWQQVLVAGSPNSAALHHLLPQVG